MRRFHLPEKVTPLGAGYHVIGRPRHRICGRQFHVYGLPADPTHLGLLPEPIPGSPIGPVSQIMASGRFSSSPSHLDAFNVLFVNVFIAATGFEPVTNGV